jgi:hypothetical protein
VETHYKRRYVLLNSDRLKMRNRFPALCVLAIGAIATLSCSKGDDEAPATHLFAQAQPGGAITGLAFQSQPTVEVRDATDHVVTTATDPVTVAIASGSGSLGGITTVNAVAGVASFSNLQITGSGTYTLKFSSGSLVAATSLPFDVTIPPIRAVSFDQYASTAALLADCTTFYCVEDHTTTGGDISLDPTVAPPGSTKSMRYHYNHGTGDGCTSITLGRTVAFPTVVQEAWAEFKVRWSTNFTTANSVCPPNDHKLIFGDTEADQSGRWALYVGNGSPPTFAIKVERPTETGGTGPYTRNLNPSKTAESLWDGNWHTVRLYFRHSTTTTSSDGRMKVWIDGELLHDETGFNTLKPAAEGGGADRLSGFSFAHNKDDGPPNVDMYIWWGPIKMFVQNPGW